MLIGRDTELAAADRLLARLEAREGAALLVVGEAGIGKTSVLAETVARARGSGVRVASARAAEFERDVPFALLEALLDEALVDPPPRVEADMGDLAELPRHRVHRAVRGLLEALAAGRRVLLVADDLHWSDEASLEALLALLHRPPRASVALLLAARPGPAALRLTEALRSRPDAERVELAPLGAADAARLLGPRHSRRERAAILDAAAGNPFYLQELARTASLEPAGDAADGGPIPAAVLAAVHAEAGQLDPEARTLLEAAAIAGDPFELDLAVAACGADRPAAVDALLAADLVRPDGRARRLRFRHPIVRAAVLQGASPAFRAAAHERLAAALAQAGASAAAQAVHVEQTARLGDTAAADLLARAGEEAAIGAPATAARWYGAALGLLGPGQRDRRLLWLAERSRALTAVGRLEDADADLREAQALAPPIPHPVALAVVTERGHVLDRLGRRDAARRLLTEALEAADPSSVAAAGLALELANQAWFSGDYAALPGYAAQARASVADLDQPELAAGAAAVSVLAAAEEGDIDAAQRFAAEAAALAGAMSDEALARRIATGHQVAFAHMSALRFRDAADIAGRTIRVARAGGDEGQMARMLQIRALALTFAADAPAAAEAADLAVDAARVAGAVPDAWDAVWTAALVDLFRGDLDGAVAHADALEALRREMPREIRGMQGALVLAMVRDATGDPARAARVLDAAGYREMAAAPIGSGAQVWWLATAARLYAAAGEVEVVAAIARALGSRPPDRHGAVWAYCAAAELLLATGEDARAEAELAVAAAPDVPLIRMWATGVAGRAHAAAGTREEAVRHFEALAAEAAACGYARFTDEAARELRRLGRRLAPRTAAAGGGGILTEREREICELAAAGRTNKEIARAVFLSEKTVEGHLSRAFAKLGVRSRVELAAAIAGQGTG